MVRGYCLNIFAVYVFQSNDFFRFIDSKIKKEDQNPLFFIYKRCKNKNN